MGVSVGFQAIAIVAALGSRQAPAPATDACLREVDALLEGVVSSTGASRAEVTAFLTDLRSQPYAEAYRQGNQLLRQPEFGDGASLASASAILGRPDLMLVDDRGNADLYYNTNGGPVNLGFQACRLIHKAVVTPAHWRGSDEELASLWAKVRHSPEWWLWQPMTGWISRVTRESPEDETPGQGSEVDLEGGMFGETGWLSFVMPQSRKCKGRWSATPVGGFVVTRGRLLFEYGPKYFPGMALPEAAGLKSKVGHAFVDCEGGRQLRIEFVGDRHGWGIGLDDTGALYRFLF
jgi:hypothetical protein